MSAHPPKPRLALAVGIIGHRPNRLPEGARETVMTAVEAVLEGIVDAARTTPQKYSGIFADEPPLLSIVSALAEGADTNVAEAALARGFVLDAPLPFAVEIYQADFATEAARAAFRDLIGRARSVLTLPGQRAAEAYAYEAAGRTVLGQSDILLTVWDGGPSAGQGGTTEMLTFAARSGIPIIHVDAKGAAATCIRWSGLSEFPAPAHAIDDLHCADLTAALPVLVDELVRLLVDELVRPPAEKSVGPQKMRLWSRPDTERDWLNRHLRDRIHRLNLRLEFPALMALFQVRPLRKTDWQPPGPGTLAREYAQFDKSASERGRLNEQSILALAYGWADAIGVWFGQVFRSAFVTNFLLAAFAVLAAALSLIWT